MAAGLALVAGVVAVVVLGSGSSKKKQPVGQLVSGKLPAVPTNHVTGSGNASFRINGNVATATIQANGVLDHAPHAMHIHAGGSGQCPPASAAGLHNGHRAISTSDGGRYYGHPRTSLTTRGPTSPASILAFTRYPATGTITYSRTFKLSATALHYIRENNAVVVIHGIDYNGNGIYDGSLDRSELNPAVQGETTAPALCGPIRAASSASASDSAHRQSAGGPQVYTASLATQAAAPSWLCHLGTG